MSKPKVKKRTRRVGKLVDMSKPKVKKRTRRVGKLVLPPRRLVYAMAMARSEEILRGKHEDHP